MLTIVNHPVSLLQMQNALTHETLLPRLLFVCLDLQLFFYINRGSVKPVLEYSAFINKPLTEVTRFTQLPCLVQFLTFGLSKQL